MLTLPVMVIETADTPWEHRSAHLESRKPWVLPMPHKTPQEPKIGLNCRAWRLGEHSSRIDVRLDLSLGCLLHWVRMVNTLEYRDRGSHCSLCMPSLRPMTDIGARGINRRIVSIRLRLRLDRDMMMQIKSVCGGCGDIVGDPRHKGRYTSIHLIPGFDLARKRRGRRRSSSSRSRSRMRRRRKLRLCLRMWRWLNLSK